MTERRMTTDVLRLSQGIKIVDRVTNELNAERVIKNQLGEDTEIFYMKEIDDYTYEELDDEDWEELE